MEANQETSNEGGTSGGSTENFHKHPNNKKNNKHNNMKRNNNKKNKNNNKHPEPGEPPQKKPQPSNKKVSHSLSWALRHAAVDIGLTMKEDGYVPVEEIINSNHSKLKGITIEQIQQVVETNDKQRFKLEERPRQLYYPEDNEDGKTVLCIRANQGHSIKLIDPEKLLTKLSPDEVRSLPCIVHGTYVEPWNLIRLQGLKKMNRTHIHFAAGLPAKEDGVVSGMRKSCTVRIYLDTTKCAHDKNLEFFTSDNGVILTDGVGNSGILPPQYFSHVTDSDGNVLLDNRGNKDT
jgi:RNA:NAD 2'-phosphotransferase (TPT1/KptA family)